MSQAITKESVKSSVERFVIFKLDDEEYGVNIQQVRELRMMEKVSRVPKAPPFIEGVMNLRGRILTIINLRKRLAFEPKGFDQDTRLIVSEVGEHHIGIIVDSVSEVSVIPTDAIDATHPLFGAHGESKFICGVAKMKDRLILLLDLEKMFTGSDLKNLEGTEKRAKGEVTLTGGDS